MTLISGSSPAGQYRTMRPGAGSAMPIGVPVNRPQFIRQGQPLIPGQIDRKAMSPSWSTHTPAAPINAPLAASERDQLMTPGQVAALFNVNPKTVTRWSAAGLLGAVRTPGGHRRFRTSEVAALLNNRTH